MPAMTDGEKAIRDLIARQFEILNWRPRTSGDWMASRPASCPAFLSIPLHVRSKRTTSKTSSLA
jgi:hypothetical protein